MNRFARSLAVHAALTALAAFAMAPLVWMAIASLRPAGNATELGLSLAPGSITLTNYEEIFTRLNLATALLNSLVVALLVTAISLVTNSMAGYAFAKLRFRGRDATSRLLAAALVVPSQVAMLPLFLLVEKLGMVNTLAGVVVPGLASVFGIFLIRQYALSLPDALLDAARIDGAGEFRIYVSVVLPLCRPALVTLGVFTFLGTWNDFLWPLVVLSDSRRQTLPVALANLLGEHVQDIELMMAGATLTVLPPVLAFVLLQRSYVRAILAGGLKQ